MAIVAGGHVNALSVVRGLVAHGIRVALIQTQPYDIAQRSRWVSETVRLNAPEGPEPLLSLLRARADEWQGSVIIPSCDSIVEVLARHGDELSERYRLAVPPWEISRELLSKQRTYAVAREAGVAVPRSYGPVAVAASQGDSLPYPVVVKPPDNLAFRHRLGKKLLVVHDSDELKAALHLLKQHDLDADVYELIPGPDSNFFNYLVYMDRSGSSAAEFVVRKLRKSPPGFGVGRVVMAAGADPLAATVRELSLRLLRAVGWRGLASVEFKLDPRHGRLVLMEANPRTALMMGPAQAAGIDFGWLAWQDATNGISTPVVSNGWNGTWIHFHADVLNALVYRSEERLTWRDYVKPYLGPKVFAVWSWRDPMPFVSQWFHTLGEGFRMIRHPGSSLRKRFRAPSALP